jgi:hypothetical protein
VRVYKYTMPGPGETLTVKLPQFSELLHVAVQLDPPPRIVLWALVDPDAPEHEFEFMTVGTGWEVPENASHVGTVLHQELVWHLFMMREEP